MSDIHVLDVPMATFREGTVTFTFQDGFSTAVPSHVLTRSSTLRDMIEIYSTEGSVAVPAPGGVLKCWLQCLQEMFLFLPCQVASPQVASPQPLLLGPTDRDRAVDILKAADYFGDDKTLQELFKQAGTWLFQPAPVSLKRNRDNDMMPPTPLSEVLRDLPGTLAFPLLRACNVPLSTHLSLLPADFHSAAVQAAFPSITSTGYISVDASLIGTTTAAAALSLFPSILHSANQTAQHLQLAAGSMLQSKATCCLPVVEQLKEALNVALQTNPVTVHLSDTSFSPVHFHKLLHMLANNSRLESLSLSLPKLTGNDGAKIAKSIRKMSSLHSMSLRFLEPSRCVESALNSLRDLPLLQTLKLSTPDRTDRYPVADRSKISDCLAAITGLKALHLDAGAADRVLACSFQNCVGSSALTCLHVSVEPQTSGCLLSQDPAIAMNTCILYFSLQFRAPPKNYWESVQSNPFNHLQVLNLSMMVADQPQMLELARHITSFPILKQFCSPILQSDCFWHVPCGKVTNDVDHEGLSQLMSALAMCSQLTRLEISAPFRTSITPDDFNLWADTCSLPSLQHLSFSTTCCNTGTFPMCVGHKSMAAMCEALPDYLQTLAWLCDLGHLTYLSLSPAPCSGRGYQQPGADSSMHVELACVCFDLNGLEQLTRLECLSLQAERVPDGYLSHLFEAMPQLPCLKDIAIGCELPWWEMPELPFHCMSSVTCLDLSFRNAMAELLKLEPEFIGGLKVLTQLQRLSLSNRRINDEGAATLAVALPHLSSLRSLSVANCGLDGHFWMLVRSFSCLTALEELDVSGNNISRVAVLHHLAKALPCMTGMRTVKCSDCGIATAADACTVLAALHGLPGLLSVDISGNVAFPLEALQSVVELLSASKSLRRVTMHRATSCKGKKASKKDGLEELRKCLRYLTAEDPLRFVELVEMCGL